MELAPTHLRQGGMGQLWALGSGQEKRKGWMSSTYRSWWVSEVDVQCLGHP